MSEIVIYTSPENETNFYNLDAIISVGYRVNSIRGTQFRQWEMLRFNSN